ncbi:hypothetical protein [Burkholderia sp. Ac-20353]|uniref:hypothetical protein n=1 Tax=Burkholderia sp. Ac-20353 TaxID=2703894 RepID=UPI00197C861A
MPAVADLGGLGAIVEESSTVATSPLAGEVLAALLREPSHASEDAALLWRTAVGNLVRGALTDTVLLEMIDAAHVCENLPEVAAEEIFTALLQKAVSTSGELSGYARAVALEGAFRFALSSRRRQLRLLSALLNITLADGPEYLRYAAKILGVAHSHWREDELVNVLTGLVDCEEAAYEATFELGMAALTSALDEPHRETAARLFAEALRWFRKAQSLREHAPEALLYVESLTLLTDFAGHRTKPELAARSVSIHKAAFELVAWHTDDSSPAWLGARHLQASCWNNLASVLISLVDSLDEVSWWEPAVVIESQVLAAYSAGRTVLKRNREGYLETLLRPRIEASIGCREGHAYLVKRWALQNHQHALIPEAHALLTGIERTMFHAVGVSRHPSEAGTVWAPVAAVLSQARCSPETENRVKELITNAFTSSLENLSGTEIDIFDHCRSTVEQHPDHRDNVRGAKLFDTVLLWTVRFLKNRLEMTKKDDAGVAYLFENVDGALPPESALQDDYFRWLSTQTAAGEIEATNLGSGRADVALKTTGERIVIEVKRELQDASFDALAKSYAGQTCDYQNVSIRLGFLLVLDLTEAKRSGTPHMRALVECRPVVRANEDAPRYVVIVKVPGRRYTPHAVRAGD